MGERGQNRQRRIRRVGRLQAHQVSATIRKAQKLTDGLVFSVRN
jgi:hypothetical protein